MIFQEPKVEFVQIDLENSVISTSTGGGQRCVASQEDSTECATFAEQTPWIEE